MSIQCYQKHKMSHIKNKNVQGFSFLLQTRIQYDLRFKSHEFFASISKM